MSKMRTATDQAQSRGEEAMKIMLSWIAFSLVLFIAGLLYANDKKVEVVLRSRIVMASSFKPTGIRVQWRIYPHPDNYWYTFRVDSDNGRTTSGSAGQLDGENERTTFPVELLGRPRVIEVYPGNYVFTACVFRKGGKEYCANEKLEVHGE